MASGRASVLSARGKGLIDLCCLGELWKEKDRRVWLPCSIELTLILTVFIVGSKGSCCLLMKFLFGKCWWSLDRFICCCYLLSSSRKGFSIWKGSFRGGIFTIKAFCYANLMCVNIMCF